jgi:anaerobic magnesium-protoporphyrin IX monomethyl ester cyclase
MPPIKIPMADAVIKQRALEENVPRGSELRDYLTGKDETARYPLPRPQPDRRAYGKGFDRIPRTLLVMPPMCMYEGAVKRVIPPLGLCYIAAQLEKEEIDADILDCVVEGIGSEERLADGVWRFGMHESEFRAHISAHDYDVFGFSMIYSSDIENLYRFAEIVKEVKPDAIVIAGGLHASIYPERFLRDGVRGGRAVIDLIIRGEGERRLGKVLRDLAAGYIDRNGDGLAGWIDGELFVNPQYEQIEDLDSLPFPAYHKVPIEKYFAHNVPFAPYPRGHRVMQILTSRGCPVGCTFCASTNFAKAYRARSVDNVIEEVEFYKTKYAIDEIQFADDNLTFNKKRSIALFSRLQASALSWCTPNGIMVNTLDNEVLEAMIRSGLYQITLSLDSGNAETLKTKHRKPVKLERIPDLMNYIASRGVLIHGTLVVGMPGETEEEICSGFRYVESLPFNSINVFIAQAIPGSELFEKAISNGTISYERALHIDTAKSILRLSSIDGRVLEQLTETFLASYNRTIYLRDPDAWTRKYRHHRDRLPQICIGTASANTSAILTAATQVGIPVA